MAKSLILGILKPKYLVMNGILDFKFIVKVKELKSNSLTAESNWLTWKNERKTDEYYTSNICCGIYTFKQLMFWARQLRK